MIFRALAFAVVLLLAACSKVTQDNFAKIKEGMSEQEVTAVLGKPTETVSGGIFGVSGASSKWANGDTTITIRFVNGKVVLRTFYKPGRKP